MCCSEHRSYICSPRAPPRAPERPYAFSNGTLPSLVFCSPRNLMTCSRFSIHCDSLESRKFHSSFSNFRRKADLTSTLRFSWSMRASMTPSEMARTTHGSTPLGLSWICFAISSRGSSDCPRDMVAKVKSRILAIASWKLRPCSSKHFSFFLWKSLRSSTAPNRKISHKMTRPPCLVLFSAFTVSSTSTSSNWITTGKVMASFRSWTVCSATSGLMSASVGSPWK
mmetsp:Transcript_88185/g.210632  ORF Transcript_88185/g.210632 Transcript_88185/m.210632 type:complete len:225 (+) Transcript_88185:31-705(+)